MDVGPDSAAATAASTQRGSTTRASLTDATKNQINTQGHHTVQVSKTAEPEPLSLSEFHATHLKTKRKISAETARKLGVVSRGQSIAFETRHNGVLLYRKFRAPPKKYWIEPGAERLCLWNVDCCRDLRRSGGTLIITEGEFDALALSELGYPCVVSVPNGAPSRAGEGDIQPEHDKLFAYLWDDDFKLIPELGEAQRIILATDSDEPGRILASELAVRLGIDRCHVVQYPPDCKDANDVLVKHGAQVLKDCINGALALVPDSLVSWSELPDREEQLALTTGWIDLDPHLKLTFPELVVVTGKPGSGKSRFTLAWVQNLARIHGVRAAYLALEDSANRIKRHALAYARSFAETDVMCPATGMVTRIGAGNEIAWLDEHLRLIGPAVTNEDVRGLPWLFEIIREAACKHFCKILVVDPWNEIEHMWARGANESEYIGQALRDLKRLGRRYGITIIIVAHPDKSAGRLEGVDDMTLYSISGGAHWKNKADGGIIVAQEMGEKGATGNTVIKVDKRKDWDVMGKPTTDKHVLLGFEDGRYTSK